MEEEDEGESMKEVEGAVPLRPARSRGIMKKGPVELTRFSQVIVTTTVNQPTLYNTCRR